MSDLRGMLNAKQPVTLPFSYQPGEAEWHGLREQASQALFWYSSTILLCGRSNVVCHWSSQWLLMTVLMLFCSLWEAVLLLSRLCFAGRQWHVISGGGGGGSRACYSGPRVTCALAPTLSVGADLLCERWLVSWSGGGLLLFGGDTGDWLWLLPWQGILHAGKWITSLPMTHPVPQGGCYVIQWGVNGITDHPPVVQYSIISVSLYWWPCGSTYCWQKGEYLEQSQALCDF